jgi:hypothetical protein
VKCYIDNSLHLRSYIRNVNGRSSFALIVVCRFPSLSLSLSLSSSDVVDDRQWEV